MAISMEIKPRNSSGLLLSVHGKRDFMVLELIDNEVVVNVENGKGPFQASFKLGDKYSLCDGNWHKVHGNYPSAFNTLYEETVVTFITFDKKYILLIIVLLSQFNTKKYCM